MPRWTSRAGAWLGIGASPGALLLGAGIAERHGGGAPLIAVLAGTVLMVAILAGQGWLGLAVPLGEGVTLGELAPRYLGRPSRTALAAMLAAAMVGWFGFNVGLGGAAAAALLNVPDPAGPLLLGIPVVAISFGGMRRWNALAVLATCSAILLTGLVVARLAAPAVPVTLDAGPAGASLADVAGFVGYVAVFGVRAPDFTAGLGRVRDLIWCVLLLVVPTVLLALAGAGLQQGTGSTDLVATLAGRGGLALGNLLVAAAVVGATFTTLYSGSLALRSLSPLSSRAAMLAVAVPGLLLAMLRFDRLLLPWLGFLAATLPALVVPMAAEGLARRRGHPPRQVAAWTWAPASAAALILTTAGNPAAPLAALALAALATAFRLLRAAQAGQTGH